MILNILLACIATPLITAILIALVPNSFLLKYSKHLSIFASGVLLAMALGHFLPESFDNVDSHALGIVMIITILCLLTFKLFTSHEHNHTQGIKSIYSLYLGSSLHTFCDGLIIAWAFMMDNSIGMIVTFTIVLHELPHIIGDYMILYSFGIRRRYCYLINLFALISTLLGAIIGIVFDNAKNDNMFYGTLTIAAMFFIYIALVEVTPRMLEQNKAISKIIYIALLALGIIVSLLVSHHH